MIAVRVPWLMAPWAGVVLSALPAIAQDGCPRASGVDAEAGWTAYAANDVAEARKRFEAALARCPDDQYARTGLGYVALRLGAVDDAAKYWQAAVNAEPENVDALTGLGLAAWRRGDLDSVREYFTRVLGVAPGHSTAVEYLRRASSAIPTERTALDPADAAWTAGDRERAATLYEARLATDPGDEAALLRRALLLAWEGRFAEGLALLDRLIALSPGDTDARLARARVRAWSGDVPAAEREVMEVLAVHPDHGEALEALALFQSWAGEADQAVETYDALVALTPGSGAAERLRARALARAARYEASRAAYDALLAEDPNDLEARLGLAQTLAYAGEYDESIAEYDRVLTVRPTDVVALVGKGRALAWSGRLVSAERVMDVAVSSDRSSATAWAGLGEVYRAEGRPADARDALTIAASLAPTDAEILDQLRSVDLSLATAAGPAVIYESDSDDNRMVTTSINASFRVTPRFDLRARGYHRDLLQGVLGRSAQGITLVSAYELGPGWLLSAGFGGSRTNGSGSPTTFEYQMGVKTPERNPVTAALSVSSMGLNETAALAELGGRITEATLSVRWNPAMDWRVDLGVGGGKVVGSQDNGRRTLAISTTRRVGSMFSLGVGGRGFAFAKDLSDGYFDPDFYGVAEVTGSWLYRTGRWTLLAEVAPGLQQVGEAGSARPSARSHTRAAYRIGPGREVSLSVAYSSAGLLTSASGEPGYRYAAVIFGSNWAF